MADGDDGMLRDAARSTQRFWPKGHEPIIPACGERIIYVDAEIIGHLLTQDRELPRTRIIYGLPRDAEYIRCFDSRTLSRHVGLVFRSQKWAPLKPGDTIPVLQLRIEGVK